ncbi:hypothetical protein ABL78_6870 [Leptomonas seymouri]|uniref:RanBP2-type domain-containing protein n=1 Tax=Leptomonas seymouri TaxID=5684 RepID=A0A0N0P3U7_LEPSE|nr:hypothetical protein ABL78_6870 [Leptomonas seymouri]|eukprot:KPI84067.1 hypothetical protein ABL78_6870 [Leptomonas seymouri]
MRSSTRHLAWGVVPSLVSHTSRPAYTPHTVLKSSNLSQCCIVSSPSLSAAVVAATRRRYVTVTLPLRKPWHDDRIRPWMCIKKECRAVNKATAAQCEACGTKKTVLQRWKCVDCGTVNFAGVKQCKSCKVPSENSNAFWMCADCCENNRVDELEGNSVCGFCGYDMAPRTAAQEEMLRRTREAAAARQLQQESYDSVSLQEAEEQFIDPLDGAQSLDPSLRGPQPLSDRVGSNGVGCSRHLKIPKVTPFVPLGTPTATKHSILHRRGRASPVKKAVKDATLAPEGPPGFDWMCRAANCGHINPGDEESCLKCGVPIKPDEWECLLCGALNHLCRSRCFHCHVSIPVCWTCKGCSTATSIYEKVCRSCGMDRPLTEPKRVNEIDASSLLRRGDVTTQRDERRGEWYCPGCQQLNFSRRTECFQCGTERPAASTAAAEEDGFAMAGWGAGAATLGQSATTQAPLHNNWICTHCQASNFRTRHNCWKCGRASESRGEWSNETIAPQFEHEGFQTGADDKPAEGQMNSNWRVNNDAWTCAKCYASNFKNRIDCYRCGASKTALRAPRRTKARRPVKL